MPCEHIGEFAGTRGANRKRISAEATRAIKHLIKTCGKPPIEMSLEIQWADHELGSYPVIAPTWEDGTRGAPWHYISRCQKVLEDYETR